MYLELNLNWLESSVSAKLCYVDQSWAFFTTKSLSDQWGDDWDDAPYEHNAGYPYSPCWHNEPEAINNPDCKRGLDPSTGKPLRKGQICQCKVCKKDWYEDGSPKFKIIKVAWEGNFITPEGKSLSVEAINSGISPWLYQKVGGKYTIVIPAGTSFDDFCKLIKEGGGKVYIEK